MILFCDFAPMRIKWCFTRDFSCCIMKKYIENNFAPQEGAQSIEIPTLKKGSVRKTARG